MEPTIYKPGAYKSPGIYNGAGVYNGAGIYKVGEGGGDIIYKTDFSNFDFANKIDYPKIGSPKAFSFNESHFEKTSVTIDGVIYPAIKHKTVSNSSFTSSFIDELDGVNLYTFETLVYKPTWGGIGGAIEYYGGSDFAGSPIINCYSSDRGYGVTRRPAVNIVSYYNGFRLLYEAFYYSTNSDIRNINGICKGGVTFDVLNNVAKVYLKNKKALITTMGKKENFRFYCDSNMELYLLGLTIIKKDLFEEME